MSWIALNGARVYPNTKLNTSFRFTYEWVLFLLAGSFAIERSPLALQRIKVLLQVLTEECIRPDYVQVGNKVVQAFQG